MSVAVASRAPTLEDARAAAEACGEAYEYVEDVLVFGSVARGDAGEDSDIDLLVLVSQDIDGQETDLFDLFCERAEKAAGVDCDVVVRTAYQWEHLTSNVSASFDATIEPEVLRLFHRKVAKRGPLSGSLNGVPRDNSDVAAEYADTAAAAMKDVVNAIKHFGEEEDVPPGREPRNREKILLEDAQSLLTKSHLAIELLIRCMGASVGNRWLGVKHDFDTMLEKIEGDATTEAGEIREAITRSLIPLRVVNGKIQNWRRTPYYGRQSKWVKLSTEENAYRHVDVVQTLALMAANQLVKPLKVNETAAEASMQLENLHDQIVRAQLRFAATEPEQTIRDHPEGVDDYPAKPGLPTQGAGRHPGPDIDF